MHSTSRGKLEDLVQQLAQFGVLALAQRNVFDDQAKDCVSYIRLGSDFRDSLQD